MTEKVLVVDSDSTTRMRSLRALVGAGYEVGIAEDTIQAGIAALEHPDLVLFGDSMATSSGFALVGRMFSTESTADIPVIVMAGDVDRYDEAMRSGARTVLTAPVPDETLVAAIAEQLTKPGALTQAPAAVLTDEHRLAAVNALRSGLTEQDSLDRFTALAAEMLSVPASTITLLESDRQLILSQVGVDPASMVTAQSSLDYSYCQYPVTSRQPLRIDDAGRHPLVQNSPAYTELDVVAYLGIPIITDDDLAVGALCVIDSVPREWSDHDVEVLNELAATLTQYFNEVKAMPGRHAAP